MKKTSTLFAIASMLCLCMAFTSCSKDKKLANRLSGGWEGDWGMSYVDRNGKKYYSHHTVIEFYPNEKFDTEGHGFQEDYYDDAPLTKIGFYFTWSIDKQKIFITYPGHSEYNRFIRDYSLKKDHFTGYIGDTHFDLDKVWKYYKWYDYAALYATQTLAVLCWIGDECYYYNDYYRYAPTRGGEPETITMPDGTTIQPLSEDLCPVRIYNRFAEYEKE